MPPPRNKALQQSREASHALLSCCAPSFRSRLLRRSAQRTVIKIEVLCWKSELFPEFWNTVVNPVLLLIEPVVVMVPVAELTPTTLPRTSPKLNDPSELTVVSILTLVLPRACCRLSSVVGTTDPASAPRIFPVPPFTLFSPARHEPCAQTAAASCAAQP